MRRMGRGAEIKLMTQSCLVSARTSNPLQMHSAGAALHQDVQPGLVLAPITPPPPPDMASAELQQSSS